MMLAAENLSVSVRNTTILRDVSLHLQPGECLGLIGPNGSGKSTLMQCLAGLRKPGKGRVLLNGHAMDRTSSKIRSRQLALVEQQAETAERITVREAVELGRIPFLSPLRPWRAEDDAKVHQALDAVDMAGLSDRLWHTLSGGERQRVHIARALAQSPEILLLDEPTNHLDIRHQLSILALVRALPVTKVIALHDLNQALACDRLVLLHDGAIVASGEPRKVLTTQHLREVFGVEARYLTPDPDEPPLIRFSCATSLSY
uniref:ABC transporter ATP-binding protein n=1 Tax=Halomonas sp. TaxID=1486246 RepID=UPI0026081E54|nr:ABC transporter ATP-binding protein [Halomonas sp.]